MIKAYITFSDDTAKVLLFQSLTEALLKVKLEIGIGDTFVIKEDGVLLAKGKVETYNLDYGRFK